MRCLFHSLSTLMLAYAQFSITQINRLNYRYKKNRIDKNRPILMEKNHVFCLFLQSNGIFKWNFGQSSGRFLTTLV